MEIIGQAIVYIMMACMVAGAIASMVRPESELGNQFVEGIYAMGPIFISVAGIFASIPYIAQFLEFAVGPVFAVVGADPSLASTTIIASDMGGYQAADALSATRESWIMAMFTGFMAGATIVYSLPIGLRMIPKHDHKYFALGCMCGFLSIPIGVLVASGICALSNPMIREVIASDAETTYQLAMQWGQIFANLIPLTVVCVAIAIGLKMVPNAMIKGFIVFGRAIDYAARTVLMLSILEMFTGCFSLLFGAWGFEPLFAYDAEHLSQAGEVVGSIACMLAGAFPMVYLIKTYLAKPLAAIGRVLDLSEMAVAGILATAANALAMFPMVKDMRSEDKVKVAAFMVAGSFIIGDHLSFTATYQPTLIVPLMVGKLVAAAIAVAFSYLLALKKARELEAEDVAAALAEGEKAAADVA